MMFHSFFRQLIALSALIAVVGCSNINTPYCVIKEFPIDKTLAEEGISAFDDCLGLIDINFAEGYFICREHRTDYYFSVYGPDFSLIGRFAKRGRGPGEYVAPDYQGSYKIKGDTLQFEIIERAIARCDLVSISRNYTHTETLFEVPKEFGVSVRSIFQRRDGGYFGISDDEDCRVFSVDSEFGNLKFADNVLDFGPYSYTHHISQTTCSVRGDRKLIAIAYYNLPQIDIRSDDCEIVKTLFIDKVLSPRKLDLESAEDYFIQVVSDDAGFYALYRDPQDPDFNFVMMFDWEGNPTAKYRINKAGSIAVDSKNKVIYAVNNYEGSPHNCSKYKY